MFEPGDLVMLPRAHSNSAKHFVDPREIALVSDVIGDTYNYTNITLKSGREFDVEGYADVNVKRLSKQTGVKNG